MDAELRKSIEGGDLAAVERLLAERPELAGETEGGVSAVLFALYRGQEEIARRLLAARGRGADVFEAAALGEVETLAAALAEDRRARDRHAADGFTPLTLAAFCGQMEALALLLENGADPNLAAANPSGVRPLHSAVAHRDREAAFLAAAALLDAGAAPNVFQQGGWTPLHSAALHGHLDLVELLLRHGADPAAESDDGQTPTDLAREKGHARVVERLSS